MKKIVLLFTIFFPISCLGQEQPRELNIIDLSGTGYELGVQHGDKLKNEISEIIIKWQENLATFIKSNNIDKSPDQLITDFFSYADFTKSIKKHTPDLYEEIRGIADGSEQSINDILLLNLIDEFWVYLFNPANHHCSGVGVPAKNGNPAYIAQNMDIEKYTDGFQTLLRIRGDENSPSQLILTFPGLVALTGMNDQGIGVCVNSLMQLQPSTNGLPVAFMIRGLIGLTEKDEVLRFVKKVKHASGQNYIIGIKEEVFDFEASSTKVVQFDSKNENGSIYHTNHPIVNNDMHTDQKWTNRYNPDMPDELKPVRSNSYIRIEALKKRMTSQFIIGDNIIKDALRSKDDQNNPVCAPFKEDRFSFTFASVIMTLTDDPFIQITIGPPDISEYARYDFEK